MFIYGRGCRRLELFSDVAAQAGEEVSAVAYAVGTINLKGLGRLTPDDFLQDYQINVVGAALAVQASLGMLKKNKGSILFFFERSGSVGVAYACLDWCG